MSITITPEAAKMMSEPQIRRLAILHGTSRDTQITAWKGTFDLPDGYIGFRVKLASNGSEIFGGIDQDGNAST